MSEMKFLTREGLGAAKRKVLDWTGIHYLQNEAVLLELPVPALREQQARKIKIYGSPMTPEFGLLGLPIKSGWPSMSEYGYADPYEILTHTPNPFTVFLNERKYEAIRMIGLLREAEAQKETYIAHFNRLYEFNLLRASDVLKLRMIKTGHPYTELNVQYRMTGDICKHVSEQFCGGRLRTHPSCKGRPHSIRFFEEMVNLFGCAPGTSFFVSVAKSSV